LNYTEYIIFPAILTEKLKNSDKPAFGFKPSSSSECKLFTLEAGNEKKQAKKSGGHKKSTGIHSFKSSCGIFQTNKLRSFQLFINPAVALMTTVSTFKLHNIQIPVNKKINFFPTTFPQSYPHSG
jgi:hypothetical protein